MGGHWPADTRVPAVRDLVIDVASLFSAHAPELRAYLALRVPEGSDPEDLVSETFLRAWRHHATFQEHKPGYARSWLFMIASNLNKDAWRLTFRQQPLSFNDDLVHVATFEPPATHIDAWDREATIAPLLAVLEPRQHDIIVSHYRDGLDQSQLAAKLGTTVEGVKKIKARALARMRKAAGVA